MPLLAGEIEELLLRPDPDGHPAVGADVTVPTASSSDVTACHSTLWLDGAPEDLPQRVPAAAVEVFWFRPVMPMTYIRHNFHGHGRHYE